MSSDDDDYEPYVSDVDVDYGDDQIDVDADLEKEVVLETEYDDRLLFRLSVSSLRAELFNLCGDQRGEENTEAVIFRSRIRVIILITGRTIDYAKYVDDFPENVLREELRLRGVADVTAGSVDELRNRLREVMSASPRALDRVDPECPICTEPFVYPVRITCGHVFCEHCIETWREDHHTCPFCRANISSQGKAVGGGKETEMTAERAALVAVRKRAKRVRHAKVRLEGAKNAQLIFAQHPARFALGERDMLTMIVDKFSGLLRAASDDDDDAHGRELAKIHTLRPDLLLFAPPPQRVE